MFQSRTEFDLLVEYWADYYADHPLEVHRGEDGEIQLVTGDPYFDKWEAEMAKGECPDLTEMFTPQQLEHYYRLRSKTSVARQHLELSEEVRNKQEALAGKLNPNRFSNTFGDD